MKENRKSSQDTNPKSARDIDEQSNKRESLQWARY